MSASPSRDRLDEHDHRRLGRDLELFSFSEAVGSGLPLWHPKGARVRALLEDYWRREHLARGYDLVYTPHVGRSRLWETSGHLDFYRERLARERDEPGNDAGGHGDSSRLSIRTPRGTTASRHLRAGLGVS